MNARPRIRGAAWSRSALLAATLASALIPALASAQTQPPVARRRAAPPTAEPSTSPATPSPSASPFDAWFASAPRVRRLANGLEVVSVHWPSPGIVAYYTLVRVGSRDEVEPGHSGFAHFFEHMMFRGTERHSAEDYSRTLQALGADNNAFTSSDYTCYTNVGASSALATFVELESDRFQHLAYTEEVFRTEAGAVRGEYQVWSSNPDQPMWEALSELAFTRHTYGHTTIGYLRDIDQMPTRYAYAQSFFRRYYTPDDAVVIVVGDFDDAELDRLVDASYAGWRGRRDRPRIPVEPAPTGGRRDLAWPSATPPRVLVGYRTPQFVQTGRARAASLVDSAALQVVHGLVFDASSPLYQRLVVDERSVLELSSMAGDQSRDPGLFIAQATLSPEPSTLGDVFAPTIDAIQQELDRLAAGGIDAQRVRDVRDHLLYGIAMSLETPASAAYFLASQLAVGSSLDDARDYFAALANVTPEDVARVARTYLTSSHRYVVTLQTGPAREPGQGAPQ